MEKKQNYQKFLGQYKYINRGIQSLRKKQHTKINKKKEALNQYMPD